MKLLVNGDNFIVFLSKKLINCESFEDPDLVNDFLKEIILKLRQYFLLNVFGYYNVIAHLDDNYGIILELEKEDLEYFEYTDDQIDMNVKVKKEVFLYEIEDFNYLQDKYFFYKEKDRIFLKPEVISDVELGQILEYSKIIYGKEALEIIHRLEMIT